jgi:hypothetical protein
MELFFWNPGLQLRHFQRWCARTAILVSLNLILAILQHGIIMEGWA